MTVKYLVTLVLLSLTSLSYVWTQPESQRKLDDSLETELKSILTLSKYFKLSLA